MELEKIKEELSRRLSEKRYVHSLGTMKSAKELAKIYGENEKEAEFAGLIHDVAKEMPKGEIEEYLTKYGIEADEIEKKQIGLLHAKLGASIAKEEFGASKEVQDAIKYHTTGNKDMNTFAKIIYLSDKMEENRTYEQVEELREIAKSDLDKAILFVLDFTIQKSIKKGTLIHPNTIELRNFIISEKNDR